MSINFDTGQVSLDDNPINNLPSGVLSDFRRMAWFMFLCILTVELLVVGILIYLMPAGRPKRPPGTQLKTMVVLGSGEPKSSPECGHRFEMGVAHC